LILKDVVVEAAALLVEGTLPEELARAASRGNPFRFTERLPSLARPTMTSPLRATTIFSSRGGCFR